MSAFPSSITNVLSDFIKNVDTVEAVVTRPIRTTDPTGMAGVFAGEWTPIEFEIRGGPIEPSIQRYTFSIEYVSKGTEEQIIASSHADASRRIRTMLYRDGDLRVALTALSETLDDVTEKVSRLGVVRQRFFSNSAGGVFSFLSHIDMWVETNT